METPNVISPVNNEVGALQKIVEFLKAGISNDRPLVLLGSEHITADVDGQAATIPSGTTMIKFFVATGDVNGRINVPGAATPNDYLYKGDQEYVEGPFAEEITHLNFIRVGGSDVEVYVKYYSQG